MSKLSDALKPKAKKAPEDKTTQYNGVKLDKDAMAELREKLGAGPDISGADMFDLIVADVAGVEPPATVAKDGALFIGKKMYVVPIPEELQKKGVEETVFNSHLALAEAIGIPAVTSGANTFRILLEKWMKKHPELFPEDAK